MSEHIDIIARLITEDPDILNESNDEFRALQRKCIENPDDEVVLLKLRNHLGRYDMLPTQIFEQALKDLQTKWASLFPCLMPIGSGSSAPSNDGKQSTFCRLQLNVGVGINGINPIYYGIDADFWPFSKLEDINKPISTVTFEVNNVPREMANSAMNLCAAIARGLFGHLTDKIEAI